MIDKILNTARRLGACHLVSGITRWRQLADLLFSPQGIEFCKHHNFPTLEMWREIAAVCPTKSLAIFIDAGDIIPQSHPNIALVGDTRARLLYSSPETRNQIIVAHGSQLDVTAEDYAVVTVSSIGSDNIVTTHTDSTALIYVD